MQDIPIALIIIGVMVLYGIIGPLVVRRLLKDRVKDGHNDIIFLFFEQSGMLYAILLGFVTVALWTSYAGTSDIVSQEGITLVPLYRQTTNMADDKRDAMRKLLRDYATSIVDDEWPAMDSTGHASSKSQAVVGDIYKLYGTFTPDTRIKEIVDAEFLRTFSEELVLRNKRLAAASSSLAPIMWVALIAGALITLAMSFFMFTEAAWPHLLMSGITAGMLGLLLFLLYVLNSPFSGSLAIGPEAFNNALATFDAIDKSGG